MSTNKMIPVPAHMKDTIEGDLQSQWAKRVGAACFEDGEELEIRNEFFRLWGKVVCKRRNARTTVTDIFFIEGEALELFNEQYA